MELLIVTGIIVVGVIVYAVAASGGLPTNSGSQKRRQASVVRTRSVSTRSDAPVFDKYRKTKARASDSDYIAVREDLRRRRNEGIGQERERLNQELDALRDAHGLPTIQRVSWIAEPSIVREAERQSWERFEPGVFCVVLSGFTRFGDPTGAQLFLEDVAGFRNQSREKMRDLIQRAIHISPQTIADGVSQEDAVRLKVALEAKGGKVKIIETVPSVPTDRATIPAQVRREVWKRDEGRCVDCSSRERLEYDHIIPVSKGGANTARNIELRCESCNRKKGASI